MSETIENNEETKENIGILYQKTVNTIGTKENVYIEEYVSDLLGPVDEFGVETIILNNDEKDDPIYENLRNIVEKTVNFVDHGVELSVPAQKGWINFILDGGIVDKTNA